MLKITRFERYYRVPLEGAADSTDQAGLCMSQPKPSVEQQQLIASIPSSLQPTLNPLRVKLCPYQVAVSRLLLRAKGSNCVSRAAKQFIARLYPRVMKSASGSWK
jgi:hypothetical protein